MLCCLSLSLPGPPSYARPLSYLDFIENNVARAVATTRWWHGSLACLKFMAVALFAMKRLGKSPGDLEVKFPTAGQGLRYQD